MKRLILSVVALFIGIIATSAQTMFENHAVLFKKDSVTVDASQEAQVELMASYFKAHPKELFFIGGFTSEDTPEERVDAICEQRANAVRQMLMQKYGVDCSNIIAIGVGVSRKYEEKEFNEKVEFFKR